MFDNNSFSRTHGPGRTDGMLNTQTGMKTKIQMTRVGFEVVGFVVVDVSEA